MLSHVSLPPDLAQRSPSLQRSPTVNVTQPRTEKKTTHALAAYPSQEAQQKGSMHDVSETKPMESSNLAVTIEVSGYQTSEIVKLYFTKKAKLLGENIVKDGFVEDTRTGRVNITFSDPKGL